MTIKEEVGQYLVGAQLLRRIFFRQGGPSNGGKKIELSRLKIHPQIKLQSSQSNLLQKTFSKLNYKSGEKQKNQQAVKKRRKSQEDFTWRSKIYLRPIILSKSTQKCNINKISDSNINNSDRKDKKLLIIKNKSYQRKDKNLNQLLDYRQISDNILKIKKSRSQLTSNNELIKEGHLDVEEQFYEQVKILQQFKQLNRMIK